MNYEIKVVDGIEFWTKKEEKGYNLLIPVLVFCFSLLVVLAAVSMFISSLNY